MWIDFFSSELVVCENSKPLFIYNLYIWDYSFFKNLDIKKVIEFFSLRKVQASSVLILAFLLYAPTIAFDYTQDDSIVITDNMFTQQGFSGISGIFKHDTFYGFFKVDGKDKLVQGGRYRPATLVSFAIEYSVFGKNPHASHFLNAFFYAILCFILYSLILLLFRGKFSDRNLGYFAWIIAILFASHPIHTEVVANIKGRDEIFVALFGLLSIFLLMRSNRNWWHIVLAYLSILIAFFSKENAIVFVVVFPMTVWFFGDRNTNLKKLWLSIIPVFFIAGIFLYIRAQILGVGISDASTELMNNPFLKFDGSKMIPYSFDEKWSTIIYNLGKYLQLMVFPYPLTSDYYPYHIAAKSFWNPWVILSCLLHVTIVGVSFWGFLKKKAWAFGFLFYMGFLFLVSNIPLAIGTNVSERFLFLPSIGFIIGIVYLVFKFFGKSLNKASYIIVPILLFFSVFTIVRSQVWKNDFTLLTTDVKNSPNSAKALNGAAGALSVESVKQTDESKRQEMILLSNSYVNKAIEIYPLYRNAYLIQGNNFYYLKQYDQAIRSYEKLLGMSPEQKSGLKNLQISLRDGGRYYGEVKQDLRTSVSYLQKAYNMNSTDYETVRLLAISYGVSGDNENAIKYFEEAKVILPEDGMAWLNLGTAYYKVGNKVKGLLHHKKAVKLDASLENRANLTGE